MSISNTLEIGKTGILANEIALGVVGNNIANVNTPGYTRQVADFEEMPDASTAFGFLAGTGVDVRGIRQMIDPFVEKQLQGSYTTSAEADAREAQLGSLAAVLNDLTDPSLGAELSKWFDATDALARNPQGLTERQTLLGASQAIASDLNRRSAALARLQQDVDDRIVEKANLANDDLQRIATLNTAIVARESTGTGANDLRDQRQQTLHELATILGITTIEDEHGAVRVDASNGVSLVIDNRVVHQISTRLDGGNPATLTGNTLHEVGVVNSAGTFLSVASTFATGEIAGLTAVRDGSVFTASSNLDLLASTFLTAVNAIQTDPAALDLDGAATVGVPLFGGTSAGTISVALADPRKIGAALSAQAGDNQNALRLADLRASQQVALGTTFQGYLALEQGRIGEDAALASDSAAASKLVNQQLAAQRESISGVNLNEELTNLLRYQRAFQASSRVITVADSTLDELLRLL
ncbi:MAG: flagellar hook-associated protein FlgK [Candidatus Binatia bacterium]